jgi:type II secretory pathway pseudopilin PulG
MLLGNFKRRPTKRDGQSGYLLIVLMLMVTLLAMAALATGPNIATQIKRDREKELVHRGAEYARAIQKFYKKFGRYPVSIEQLENTNNIRFLRKRYKDPITGKDFRLLHFGEVSLTPGSAPTTTGSGVTSGALSSGSGMMSGPLSSSQSPTGIMGTGDTSALGGTAGATQASGQPTNASGISSPIGTGPTFGGGPIIGVASTSKKQSLMAFNGKDHYNEWLFIYDPTTDRGALITGPYVPTQAGTGGVLPGGMTPTATPQSGFGNNNSVFGQPSTFGQPPGPSPQPQNPQQ